MALAAGSLMLLVLFSPDAAQACKIKDGLRGPIATASAAAGKAATASPQIVASPAPTDKSVPARRIGTCCGGEFDADGSRCPGANCSFCSAALPFPPTTVSRDDAGGAHVASARGSLVFAVAESLFRPPRIFA
ncbi:MAG: hypothetical protein BroJett024_17210 [Alphaproteobacteria bacterium]|nr:MAG: hypothetical protein BroJett024_17210 [Alphaproteobacteria bacterium]